MTKGDPACRRPLRPSPHGSACCVLRVFQLRPQRSDAASQLGTLPPTGPESPMSKGDQHHARALCVTSETGAIRASVWVSAPVQTGSTVHRATRDCTSLLFIRPRSWTAPVPFWAGPQEVPGAFHPRQPSVPSPPATARFPRLGNKVTKPPRPGHHLNPAQQQLQL